MSWQWVCPNSLYFPKELGLPPLMGLWGTGILQSRGANRKSLPEKACPVIPNYHEALFLTGYSFVSYWTWPACQQSICPCTRKSPMLSNDITKSQMLISSPTCTIHLHPTNTLLSGYITNACLNRLSWKLLLYILQSKSQFGFHEIPSGRQPHPKVYYLFPIYTSAQVWVF